MYVDGIRVDRRPLIVAAHPDDETIGCGGLLGRASGAHVVHLTDGAPRDRRFWPASFVGDLALYRLTRRREALRALSLVGLSADDVSVAGACDQEASFEMPRLATWLAALARTLGSEVLIAHPYEGGHPDHDAGAWIAQAACALLRTEAQNAPLLVEMTSYHAPGGEFATGRFLGPDRGDVAVLALSAQERSRKREMMQYYASQSDVLARFESDCERFRRAPQYDFSLPPHDGELYYEQLGWPLSGASWRRLASEASDLLFQENA